MGCVPPSHSRVLRPSTPDPPTDSAETASPALVTEREFRRLRYALGVGEGEVEIPTGTAIPLEHNLDALNGVSYSKGCYVGQERVSFTHFRGVIRKRLMPVALHPSTGECRSDQIRVLASVSLELLVQCSGALLIVTWHRFPEPEPEAEIG